MLEDVVLEEHIYTLLMQALFFFFLVRIHRPRKAYVHTRERGCGCDQHSRSVCAEHGDNPDAYLGTYRCRCRVPAVAAPRTRVVL